MRLAVFLAVIPLVGATPCLAQRTDTAAFIVRLGTDTTSIERYIRTNEQLIVEAVQRSPSTMVHRLVLDLGPQGSIRRGFWTVSPPGSDVNVIERTIRFDGDSAVIATNQGGRTTTRTVLAKNAIPIAGPFYSPYELAVMRGLTSRSQPQRVYLVTASDTVGIPIARLGRDSVTLTNQFGEPMRAHIDASGRILHLHTPAFTTVERTRWLDLESLARVFAARDSIGKGLGQLSPRHTYRVRVGAANLWVDYSRPAMRGRPVWGALVPHGTVWRTGANEASHFATDRPIELGNLTLAPGTYTLFLLPTADDWTLIVNSGTGMSGLDRDEKKDVGRVKLEKRSVDRPIESFTIDVQEVSGRGELAVAWDRIRATVPIVVK